MYNVVVSSIMPTVAKRNRSLSESSITREDKRRANNSEKTEYNMDLNDIKTSITGINDTLQMILTQSNKTNDDLEEIKKDNREYKKKGRYAWKSCCNLN